jgi:hypothetical protein
VSRIQNVISETKSYRNNQEVCTFYLAKIQEENSSLHSAESRCVLYCHCAPSSFFPKSSLQNWVNQQSWTFLFVKTDSWICQHLFDSRFRETSQNFSSFRHPIEKIEIKVICMSWNFLRFHKIQNLSCLSWKKISCIPKKNELSHMARIVLFSSNRWRLDGAILEWRFCFFLRALQ